MMGRVMLDIDDGTPLAGLRQKQAICGNCSANSARMDGSVKGERERKTKRLKWVRFKLLKILRTKRKKTTAFENRTRFELANFIAQIILSVYFLDLSLSLSLFKLTHCDKTGKKQ